mmetsp:Transcript_86302/g.244823  ORF Transcript_86302/g.244823 Transcript_86302/m.244823 type:complete len:102 (-) Transcript_86302:45-350(-)
MAEPGSSGAAGSSDEPKVEAAERERSCARDCGEGTLDCFAFFGRGVVQSGKGCYTAAKHTAYPVKEGCLRTRDGCTNYLHPYQQKKPVGDVVPSFRYTGPS